MTKKAPNSKEMPATRVDLPRVLDLPGAGTLRAALADLRGTPVAINAEAVERMGGLAQQVLLAAAQSWRVEALPFAIVAPSEGFFRSAEALGVDFTPFLEGAPQ